MLYYSYNPSFSWEDVRAISNMLVHKVAWKMFIPFKHIRTQKDGQTSKPSVVPATVTCSCSCQSQPQPIVRTATVNRSRDRRTCQWKPQSWITAAIVSHCANQQDRICKRQFQQHSAIAAKSRDCQPRPQAPITAVRNSTESFADSNTNSSDLHRICRCSATLRTLYLLGKLSIKFKICSHVRLRGKSAPLKLTRTQKDGQTSKSVVTATVTCSRNCRSQPHPLIRQGTVNRSHHRRTCQ